MKTKVIGGIVVLMLALGTGYYISRDMRGGSVEDGRTEAERMRDALQAQIGDGATVEIVEDDVLPEGVAIPEIEKPIAYPAHFDENARNAVQANFDIVLDILREDPADFAAWIDLGILRKTVGDLAGAEEAWVFAGQIRPHNTLSFHNLGDLYHYHMKEYEKAESAFRRAIENDPGFTPAYLGLSELYRHSYKQNTDLGALTLLEGIRAVGDDVTLLAALAAYYKERGSMDRAKEYYQKAADAAAAEGDENLRRAYQEEADRL